MEPLEDRVRAQAGHCRRAGSPLTAAILSGAADDLAAGGPTAALLGPLERNPPGSVPALRLAGACTGWSWNAAPPSAGARAGRRQVVRLPAPPDYLARWPHPPARGLRGPWTTGPLDG
ncbi:MAG: DUF2332 family protein [Mycobacteriales bacterium]